MPMPAQPHAEHSAMKDPKLRKCCGTCGGENVKFDAWAIWDAEAQRWEVATTFDYAVCDDCDGETRVVDQPL
jgi:hypothetical protein